MELSPDHDEKEAHGGADQPEEEQGKVGDGEEGEDERQDDKCAQTILGVLRPAEVVEHGAVKLRVFQPPHHVLKVGGDEGDVHREEDEGHQQLLSSVLLHLENGAETVCDVRDLEERCLPLFLNLETLFHEEGVDDADDADGEGCEENHKVAVVRIVKLVGDEAAEIKGYSQGDGDGTYRL